MLWQAALLALNTGWLSLVVPVGKPPADRLLPVVAAARPVRFVAFGDFGTGAEIQYRVAQAIAKKCAASGCDFAVTLGDNIYNDGVSSVNDAQFRTKFELPYAPLPLRFYMSLGNHDYRGNVQAQIDYTYRSRKWTLPARYYSFSEGPVTFFALDTNQPDAAQLAFVKAQLAKVHTPWVIPFGHHPRFTNGVYKNTQSPALKQLIDSFCGRARIYLSGHEHNKQVLKPYCGMEYLIAGTAAGNRDSGSAGNTLYAGKSFGFSWLSVDAQRLHFELLDSNGHIEYQQTLTR